VITTSAPDIADPLRHLVATYFGNDEPLLVRARRTRALGVVAYWLLVGAALGLGAYMAATYVHDLKGIDNWRTLVVEVATTLASTNWFGIAARTAWHHFWLVGTATVGLFLMLWVDHRLDDRYSEFWHGLRAPMRSLLERR
jgi:H+/Cl- antiporter ClcA